MARTHFVKAYRGQSKCQWSADRVQYAKCKQPLSAHLYRFYDNDPDGPDEDFYKLTNSTEWTIEGHPFTQTPIKCQFCGQPINIGDPYKWVAPRAYRGDRGRRMNRHTTCPGWKPSELTSSQHLATIYAAQEGAEDTLSKMSAPEDPDDAEAFLDELRGVAEQFADEIGEAVESYRESAQNIEDGFQHPTYQSEELNQKAEEVEAWADEVQYWQGTDFDGEDLEDWADSQLSEIDEMIANSPL